MVRMLRITTPIIKGIGSVKARYCEDALDGFQLPNVWLLTSIEDQASADERIPHLLRTPAAVRGVSCEPLLGPVSFRWALWRGLAKEPGETVDHLDGLRQLDWVICGSESGPGRRETDLEWVRTIRDQCIEASVPFFLKQLHVSGEKISMPYLDGREWNEMPEMGT